MFSIPSRGWKVQSQQPSYYNFQLVRQAAMLMLVAALAVAAWAQDVVIIPPVKAGSERPSVIAIPDFPAAPSSAQQMREGLIRDVIYKDLEVTGYFLRPRNQAFVEQQHRADLRRGPLQSGQVEWPAWNRIGAEFLVRAEYRLGADQSLAAEVFLYDMRGTLIFRQDFAGATHAEYAKLAHRIADEIVLRIKGIPGIASTKFLFVSDRTGTTEIWMMDANGDNQQQVTTLNNLTLTPAWGANMTEVYFTSYVKRNPDAWGQVLRTGQVWPISRSGGLNTSPNWSEKAQRLVITLGKDGNSEIYTMTRSGQEMRRLTRNRSIDSSPVWSPDGGSIFFTSDRDGGPQIFRMNADGSNPRRLTWQGSYNDGVSVSPDGRRLAFSGRIGGGRFQVFVSDINGKGWSQLTSQGDNQDPTWAPDSRHLAFVSTMRGGKQIFMIDADTGQSLVQLTTRGVNRQPAWSPAGH